MTAFGHIPSALDDFATHWHAMPKAPGPAIVAVPRPETAKKPWRKPRLKLIRKIWPNRPKTPKTQKSIQIAQRLAAQDVSKRVRHVPISDVKQAVCAHFNIPLSSMRSAGRGRAIARPRQVAMYLSREFSGSSLPAIGAQFGGRDHTTVLHACRAVTRLCADHNFALMMADLRRLLTEHAARLAEYVGRIVETPTLVTVAGPPKIVEPKRKPQALISIIQKPCRIQRCHREALKDEVYCHRHNPRRPPMPEGWTAGPTVQERMSGR